jgi:hypothetical protein
MPMISGMVKDQRVVLVSGGSVPGFRDLVGPSSDRRIGNRKLDWTIPNRTVRSVTVG